ncbi:hypothetical protein JIN85_08115 [Luteolibacter pohnpeiensis]|uniref:Uncharacterized protein n=1 Tax=Luteolibacter pohnpeiensis TaxID=454153 RepID=A0A934S6W6_9BACT|nr:hypothetical protein [Luteolibacter pohnpeiensis]MBK1882375.1 hypothetical protein [Luteolibacter pohnpeiensis]
MSTTTSADPIHVPRTAMAVWVERLIWLFALSFAFDYRASESRAANGGVGLDQLLFLGLCISSTFAIVAIGWKYLTVRPGAWLIGFWGCFIAYMMANAFLQGVAPGRTIRIILPLCFVLAGMVNVHIATCMGIRPSRIVAAVFTAACINVIWRIVYGLAFTEITLETARTEVQSTASNWLAAWIGCAILLRPKFHWTLLVACGVLFTGVLVTVTRSLLFPVFTSAMATSFCYWLGIKWGIFEWGKLPRRLLPVGAATMLILSALIVAFVAFPELIDRWDERLFHLAADKNLSADISYLTRRAEADAMFKILSDDPVHFINGRGIGASYYWDPAYLPEILLDYPPDMEIETDMWFAGHSTWIYSIFSGGIIGLIAHAAFFGAIMVFSLRGAASNSSHPGPDQWLAFLPFIAVCCLMSETLTSNPLQERLTGVLLGMMAGLPQAFLVRSSWIHLSTRRNG